jgi:wyosine [tRNA(Phe)-imidazoG37] synthetase (radical SAM superfamily)
MRGAVRDVTPLRSICMRERAYNFSAHLELDKAHSPYCTKACQYCHAARGKLKLETAYHPQRENFTHAGQSRMRIQMCMTL